MLSIQEIEKYLDGIKIEMLSLEELEHYTNIIIAIENKKLDDAQRKQLNKKVLKGC